MHIADGVVAQVLIEPLQTLADDGGAQVADVQRLGHIGAAVVHHNGLARTGHGNAEFFRGAHLFQIALQEAAGELQIDKARHNRLNQAVVLGVQLLHHCLGDLNGGTLVLLGGGQSAVALIFAQVRPVGYGDPAKGGVIARGLKGLLHFFGDDV